MRAYIINLDSATDRWAFVERSFQVSRLEVCRVPAISVKELHFPHPDFSETSYRRLHGRSLNRCEVACYFSHLKVMRLFLATGESHALIGEDDISLGPDFDGVLQAAMDHSGSWNILRLTGLSARLPLKVAPLTNHYSLSINLGRTKGAGAYVLDRRAAETLLTRLLPMRLPFDHAIDREWFFGLRSLAVHPFPGSQVEGDFLSTVQRGTFPKLAESRRLITVYPYQFVNETLRLWFRGGRYLWARMRG